MLRMRERFKSKSEGGIKVKEVRDTFLKNNRNNGILGFL